MGLALMLAVSLNFRSGGKCRRDGRCIARVRPKLPPLPFEEAPRKFDAFNENHGRPTDEYLSKRMSRRIRKGESPNSRGRSFPRRGGSRIQQSARARISGNEKSICNVTSGSSWEVSGNKKTVENITTGSYWEKWNSSRFIGRIKRAEDSNEWENCLKFKERMKECGHELTHVAYESIISALSRRNEWEKALSEFEEMKSKSFKPSSTCYAALIYAGDIAKNRELVVKLFNEMKRQGFTQHSVLFGLTNFFKDARKRGVQMSTVKEWKQYNQDERLLFHRIALKTKERVHFIANKAKNDSDLRESLEMLAELLGPGSVPHLVLHQKGFLIDYEDLTLLDEENIDDNIYEDFDE